MKRHVRSCLSLVYLLFLVVVVLPGCISQATRGTRTVKNDTSRPEPVVVEDEGPPPEVQYTFLDTVNKGNELVLSDEDFDNDEKKSVPEDVSSENGAARLRVQVFASNKIDVIREQKKILERKISDPLVIGYEAPYYKLYAGSFLQRADAKKLLFKIKKLGYTDAWVVSTNVVPEN